MKTNVYLTFTYWDEFLFVSGTLNQSLLRIKETIKESDWNYSSDEIEVKENLDNNGFYVYTWNMPNKRDDISRLVESFHIELCEIETDDFEGDYNG